MKQTAEIKVRLEQEMEAKRLAYENARIQAKQEEEAEAAEKARQEELEPDRDKLMTFAEMIYGIRGPDTKSIEAHEIVKSAVKSLGEIVKQIAKGAEEL